MRIFLSREALVDLCMYAVKHRFSKTFFSGFRLKALTRIFNQLAWRETFLSATLLVPRVVERLIKSLVRRMMTSATRDADINIYSKAYFLDEQGRFSV